MGGGGINWGRLVGHRLAFKPQYSEGMLVLADALAELILRGSKVEIIPTSQSTKQNPVAPSTASSYSDFTTLQASLFPFGNHVSSGLSSPSKSQAPAVPGSLRVLSDITKYPTVAPANNHPVYS
jgi:hypothetical protein